MIETLHRSRVEQSKDDLSVEDAAYAGRLAEWTCWRKEALERLEDRQYVSVFKDILACTSEAEPEPLPTYAPKLELEDDFFTLIQDEDPSLPNDI